MEKENEIVERLKYFIEHIGDSVWCFELPSPLDLNLPLEEKVKQSFQAIRVECNTAYSEMYGLSREEMLGRKLDDIMPYDNPINQTYLRTFFENNCRIDNVISHEFDPQGNEKWILNSMFGEIVEGKIIRAWGRQSDITELKHLQEKELAAADREKVAVIDAMPDSLVVLSLGGEMISVNPAHLKMFGHKSADEILGKGFEGFKERFPDPEKDIPRFLGLFKEVIEKGFVEEPVELRLRGVDGKEFMVSASANLLRDAGGNPKNVVATLRDVTERKRVQDEIVAAKDYTENIIKSMIDTLIVVNPDATIRTINRVTLELLGYEEKELIGQPVGIIFAEEEEEEEEEALFKGTRLKKLIEEGAVRDYDMKYRTKKGKVIPVSFSGSVMRDKDGKLVGIVGIARDMREIRRLMEKEKELAVATAEEAEKKRADELRKFSKEIQQTRKELQMSYTELQNSKDELVRSEKFAFTGRISASIAHEIRNPLTNMSMSVRQLKKLFKPKDRGAKHIDIIIRNTERINYLITELLNSARPPKLDIQPFDIHRILEGILESTKVRSQKIKVVKKFTSKSSIINVDKAQIERVFLNIVINAIESMPKGGELTIITEVDEKLFMIKIQDKGKGIPEEDIIRIFDPFFSSKPDGVGLGLTICYGIIVSHGGTIEVESKQKKGSIFTVFLPIEQKVKRGRG